MLEGFVTCRLILNIKIGIWVENWEFISDSLSSLKFHKQFLVHSIIRDKLCVIKKGVLYLCNEKRVILFIYLLQEELSIFII